MMYYNDYWFFSPFHFLFSLIGWLIIIWLIVWFVRRMSHRDKHWVDRTRGLFHDPAMDTLRERYAKGEINKEEFEERKKILENK